MLWGYSPAQDILGVLMSLNAEEVKRKQTLHILLAGCSDIRHILKTLAKYYTHEVEVTVHFYIAEVLLDLVARDLLLLMLALEPSDRIPVVQKTHLWMELFGNSLIRPLTMEYLIEKSQQLIHLVTDSDFLSFRLPCADLSDLKYKEKDQLESCFKYWMKNDFNISVHWDRRLRKSLGTRYDSKNGVFEWDYYMKMKDKPGDLLVVSNEYNQWRKNGVAFVWLETEYCMSNPTFAMGVHSIGDQLMEFGYLGDMEIGPYYTFASDCEDEKMLGKNHHHNLKRGTDIFERNLTRCFHEIENQKPYVHEITDDRNLGPVVLKINELDVNPKPRLEAEVSKAKETYGSIPIKHKIIFLNTKSVETLPKKSKFNSFFDAVFVAQCMEKILTRNDYHKTFFSMVRRDGIVLWETRKSHLNISKEGLKDYENSVKALMKDNHFEPVGTTNFDEEFVVKFIKTGTSQQPSNESENETVISPVEEIVKELCIEEIR